MAESMPCVPHEQHIGGVAFGVIGGVMGHGDDQLAVLFGKLLEEFLLQKLEVDDGEGGAGLLRGEDVAVAERGR